MDFSIIFRRAVLVSVVGLFSSCATPGPQIPQGHWGFSEQRRVVIAGENVKAEIAEYYEKEYQAPVWFTPYKGKWANNRDNFFESGIGPSRAMRSLVGELKSLNHTFGRWEIIVPKLAERYFLKTLKSMEASSLAKARGLIMLTETDSFLELEREVQRVSDGSFFVAYQSEKK